MSEKRDIFDKLMALPILNNFEPFYKRNKEVLLYLFFGGLTCIISIVSYAFFGGRVATLVVEEIILLVFVSLLAFPSVPVKVVAQVIVIILNYIISKFFVF